MTWVIQKPSQQGLPAISKTQVDKNNLSQSVQQPTPQQPAGQPQQTGGKSNWIIQKPDPEERRVQLEEEFETSNDPKRRKEIANELYGTNSTLALSKSLLKGATMGMSESPFAMLALSGFYPEAAKALENEVESPYALTEKEKEHLGGFATGAEIVGSTFPVSKVLGFFGNAGKKAMAQIPRAGPKLVSLGNMLGIGVGGAAYEGAEEAIQGKLPSVEDMAQNGAVWLALDVGLNALGKAGQFTKNLLKGSKNTGVSSWDTLSKVVDTLKQEGAIDLKNPEALAIKAFDNLEQSIKGTKGKPIQAKPELKPTSKVESDSIEATKQTFRETKPYIAKDVEKAVAEHAPRYNDKKAFGQGVKDSIESQKKAVSDTVKPLYERVKEQSSNILYTAENTAKKAYETIQELNSLKTKPQGYNNAVNKLETILEDLGYTVQKEDGVITEVLAPSGDGGQTVNKLIDLSRRIAELGDFETLEPSIKKIFNQLSKGLKEEAKLALKSNPKAYNAFLDAEKTYADMAKKLERDSIYKIRQLENTEKIADLIRSPTVLEDLKKTLPKEEFAKVERELLEHFNELEPSKARKLYREVQSYLTPEGRRLAQQTIIQSEFNAFSKEVVKDGVIDFEKISKAMKNPSTRAVIEEVGGSEAVSFFENLSRLEGELNANIAKMQTKEALGASKQLKEDAIRKPISKDTAKSRLEQQEAREARGKHLLEKAVRKRHPAKAWLNDLAEDLGTTDKTILGIVLATTLGVGKTATVLGTKVLYKMAHNPRTRKSYMDMLKASRKDKPLFTSAFKTFANTIEEEDQD